jgi:PadR family transcriptional regulator, regulatory protein PadR
MDQISQLEQYVLAVVFRLNGVAYGVSIQEELYKRSQSYSIGAIYAVLDKLEKKGFVASKRGEPTAERGGRAKTYFNLTAPGKKALQTSVATLNSLIADTSLKPVMA